MARFRSSFFSTIAAIFNCRHLRGDWQPIATAPQDGVRVLLFQPCEGGCFAPADKDTAYYIFTGWWDDGEWRCAEYDAFPKKPTHWMIEPSPPGAYLHPCNPPSPGIS